MPCLNHFASSIHYHLPPTWRNGARSRPFARRRCACPPSASGARRAMRLQCSGCSCPDLSIAGFAAHASFVDVRETGGFPRKCHCDGCVWFVGLRRGCGSRVMLERLQSSGEISMPLELRHHVTDVYSNMTTGIPSPSRVRQRLGVEHNRSNNKEKISRVEHKIKAKALLSGSLHFRI